MLNENLERENTGFISLWRCVTDWEWYTDVNTFKLFIHCLLKANFKDKSWQGIRIERGSFITSLDNLAFETGLSKMQVRTAIKKLKLTHEITHKTTSHYSIITVNNYNSYQPNNTQVNTQITYKQHTSNTQVTLTNNDNNVNNDNNNIYINKEKKLKFGEFKNVLLSDKEYKSLEDIYKNKLNDAIETLSNYLKSKGDKYKNHYAVLRKNNWVYEKIMKENNQFEDKNKKVEEEYNFGIG